MYNKILVIDKEIKEYDELDRVIKESRIFDGGLDFLLGIETQEELDQANPWVSYEDGCTVIYEENAELCKTEHIHVPMEVKEMRELLKMNRPQFSFKYHIPVRTIENWESGTTKAPDYVLYLLERAVLEDSNK